MFSPGTKRLNQSARRGAAAAPGSPATPAADNRVPKRPSTGTPAPWAPQLSVLARVSVAKEDEKSGKIDPTKPVFVEEFPREVRDELLILQQKHSLGDACISGGFGSPDHTTSLSWMVCADRVFIWSHSTPSASKNFITLSIPSNITEVGITDGGIHQDSGWMLCFVKWTIGKRVTRKAAHESKSTGVLMCNKRTRAVVYWPDIYSDIKSTPVSSTASDNELDIFAPPADGSTSLKRQRKGSRVRSSSTGSYVLNSLIVSPIPNRHEECVALVCSSKGDLWQFHCSRHSINRKRVYTHTPDSLSQGNDASQSAACKGYPRSLTWRFHHTSLEESFREFFILTECEIKCFAIKFSSDLEVSKLWSDEIIGNDAEFGIKKGLAGQKHIWPLDLQVDVSGKILTVLVATLCKDRVSGSSYTQYSLLTMQYKSGFTIPSSVGEPIQGRILEKKAPAQVIIPKARFEKDENFLFSMKLRVGGRPSGSAIILSGDGTATVFHYYRSATRLYQFDLPYDAGKVLDASVLPVADDSEEGSWVVFTEKAGIWAIPEKAIVLGGVEPPERSLSRKGSSNEGSSQAEMRNVTFAGEIAPRRVSSEAWDSGDRQRAIMTGVARRTAQDEESEALLSSLFNDFLLSGQVDNSLEKLKIAGAFEREGEANVFARTSKSIVDTLAKHWLTTTGNEIVSTAVVSTQLKDKQQKHQKFLQFLALSKCHEELCTQQRSSLLNILEHGEKLAGMIQLRKLQNIISQNRSAAASPSDSVHETSSSLWHLIQLVGERACSNAVHLRGRERAEVFYSKVSDLEEVFYCLEKQLNDLIGVEKPLGVQVQRALELADACVTIIRTAMDYKREFHLWYPPPEGLAPWYCQLVVRNGLWNLASFMLQQLNDASFDTLSAKPKIFTQLEALTEVLLESYTGAITAKVERQEQERGLLEEYWNRRDALLDSLYQQTKDLLTTGKQDLIGSSEKYEEVHKDLITRLLGIAKQHECYGTLWNICCDLNDSMLLKTLMHESMGPKGGFSYYVFQQLHARREFSKLLRLGEEFPEELAIFLKQHHDLLWLHEVFLHQYTSASETLHELAISQDQGSGMEADEEAESEVWDLNLADRKRFLNLAKIAALAAGNDDDTQAKMKLLEADLRILKLQEELMRDLDEESKINIGKRLLRPEDLITLCLSCNKPGTTLRAFEIFAWTSSSFRRRHKALLEECWKSAADEDDWGKLYMAYMAEGWSDEETLRVLRSTGLFQASSRCYGPEAETFEEGFDEVMPLREEGLSSRDLECSVEGILMQHKSFPDAGKLMRTAVEWGSMQGMIGNEDGPVPME